MYALVFGKFGQRRGKSESAVTQSTSDRRQRPWKLRGRQLFSRGDDANDVER
jgi:hypothetical protein